ncbi:MAG: hypothetical protein ACK5TK_16380 [Betaproteobacteria bacterium]
MAFYNRTKDRHTFVASFAGRPEAQFAIYARGYREAAARLTQQLCLATHFADYEAYPVVFLYRHALELTLKSVILAASELAGLTFDRAVVSGLRAHHDLDRLGLEVVNIVAKWFPEDGQTLAYAAQIRTVCSELQALDPASDAYRYPAKPKGEASTKPNQDVNLRDLATGVEPVLDLLDGAEAALRRQTECAADSRLFMEELFVRIANG